MQRKKGVLTDLEMQILATGIDLRNEGQAEFHGFLLARELKERHGGLFRTAYGPLYKALDRMAGHGLLVARWEDPEEAAIERRPRRCLYQVTAAGITALATNINLRREVQEGGAPA